MSSLRRQLARVFGFDDHVTGVTSVTAGTNTPPTVERATSIGDASPGREPGEAATWYRSADPATLRAPLSAFSPEGWQAFFDERAGIVEHDGGAARRVAEMEAFEHCIAEWHVRNPVSSEEGSCAQCGEHEAADAVVAPYGTAGNYVWLHPRCWLAWSDARRRCAEESLLLLGVLPPDAA